MAPAATRARGAVPRAGAGALSHPASAPSTSPATTTTTPAASRLLLVTEPAWPVWALPALLATAAAALAVLPGAPAAASAAAALEAGALARRRAPPRRGWGASAAWRAAAGSTAPVLAADLLLAVALLAFFKAAEAYGRARHVRGTVPPYRGPWLCGPGRGAAPVPPRWFAPAYLLLALTAAFLLPAGALTAHALTAGRAAGFAPDPAAAAALIPYLALFLTQYACEMGLLRRSFLAPAVPLAFMLVRPWQLARGLALARGGGSGGSVGFGVTGAWPPAPAWCPALLTFLSVFWTFDTAALLVWLPWTYNWHLQGRGSGGAAK
jgi:hypothetical protein